jgi:hypothetical protein
VEFNNQVKAMVKQERDKMEQEKEIIKKDMKFKDAVIEQLRAQVKDQEQKIRVIEAQLPEGEKGLKMQLLNYQKNMDQLTIMYQQLGSDKNLLSKDKKVIDLKLQRINEKYNALDSQYKVVRE